MPDLSPLGLRLGKEIRPTQAPTRPAGPYACQVRNSFALLPGFPALIEREADTGNMRRHRKRFQEASITSPLTEGIGGKSNAILVD